MKKKTSVFKMPTKAFTTRAPEELLNEFYKEAKEMGRKYEAHFTAILAERYGLI